MGCSVTASSNTAAARVTAPSSSKPTSNPATVRNGFAKPSFNTTPCANSACMSSAAATLPSHPGKVSFDMNAFRPVGPDVQVRGSRKQAQLRPTNSDAQYGRRELARASIWNGWLVAPYGGPGATRHRPGSTVCGRKGRGDPGTVRRAIDETLPDDCADIPAVLAKQFVVPEAANYLARPGVQRTSRDL